MPNPDTEPLPFHHFFITLSFPGPRRITLSAFGRTTPDGERKLYSVSSRRVRISFPVTEREREKEGEMVGVSPELFLFAKREQGSENGRGEGGEKMKNGRERGLVSGYGIIRH